jgi:hypothetical protein
VKRKIFEDKYGAICYVTEQEGTLEPKKVLTIEWSIKPELWFQDEIEFQSFILELINFNKEKQDEYNNR